MSFLACELSSILLVEKRPRIVPADVDRARLIWLVAQFRRVIKMAGVMKKAYETLQQ